jgi:hypothetical protein
VGRQECRIGFEIGNGCKIENIEGIEFASDPRFDVVAKKLILSLDSNPILKLHARSPKVRLMVTAHFVKSPTDSNVLTRVSKIVPLNELDKDFRKFIESPQNWIDLTAYVYPILKKSAGALQLKKPRVALKELDKITSNDRIVNAERNYLKGLCHQELKHRKQSSESFLLAEKLSFDPDLQYKARLGRSLAAKGLPVQKKQLVFYRPRSYKLPPMLEEGIDY